MAVSKAKETTKSKQGNKTVKTEKSIEKFINGVEDVQRRKDCQAISDLMAKVTKQEPKMWGDAIIGFGEYHYKYESGREGDSCIIGLSPRKQNLTIYMGCKSEKSQELLKNLGKHKLSGGCLHINKVSDIDLTVLSKLIKQAYDEKK